jgi:membrane-bound serine protease (ClpP class)
MTLMMTVLGGGAAALASESPAATTGNRTVTGTIVIIEVKQTIETGLQAFLERAFAEADAMGADKIVLRLDTFGGRVDAAIAIGELIRSSPIPTVVYIEGKAISAGSYIALNADEIVMQQGSTIGAAAVVTGSGERVTDSKVISMWVSEMRSAAEAKGRNPDIAQGMVDEKFQVEMPEIERTKKPGEILSLTSKEAVLVGYAKQETASFDTWLQGMDSNRIETIEPTLAERLARVLTHPTTTTILFILGIAGILIELLVPGFGIPGVVGIVSFGLYFLGNYVAGFAGIEHIVLFIAGVVLLLLEIFVPSFGILGIVGILSLISGVVLAAYDRGNAMTLLGIAVLVAAVVVAIFVRYFKHRGVWNRFILKDTLNTQSGYNSHDEKREMIGKAGVALTPLRPAGVILLEDKRVDVVTNGEFIVAGTQVEVIAIEGIRVVVKQAPPPSEGEAN